MTGSERNGGGDFSVLLRLPADLRGELKDPLGTIYTETAELLEAVGPDGDGQSGTDGNGPLITIGDVVTAHILTADRTPDVAVVDGKTERQDAPDWVDRSIANTTDVFRSVSVENPAAVVTRELVSSLRAAIESPDATLIRVRGEEDLAALPAILAAPTGASVLYGQPGSGMVHVPVTATAKQRVRELLTQFEGDVETAFDLLDPETS